VANLHDANRPIQVVLIFKEKVLLGKPFLAKGYCIDTVGVNAEMIRKYVKYREKLEKDSEIE